MVVEKSETDQFWEWLFEESKHGIYDTREIENWLRNKLDEWAKLPVHTCGYRATKTVYIQKRCAHVEDKIVCAHCGEFIKKIDRRPELREMLKNLKKQAKELEEVLEE